MITTKEEINDEYEASVQKAWLEAINADPSLSAKAAFREGFARGTMFATLILAKGIESAVGLVTKSGK